MLRLNILKGNNMPTKYKVYPYKMSSGSAKVLAKGLQVKRVHPDGSYYHYNNHTIINWGSSTVPEWYDISKWYKWLNLPSKVALASNKLHTLAELDNASVSIPLYTTNIDVAKDWIDEGRIAVCRKTLTGHSGQGIIIARSKEELVDAPLYTQHARHSREFRIHIFNGMVIDATEKKRRSGSDADTLVRNHHTGWVYTREGLVVPINVLAQSIKAVSALGLDFGAVDVGYRERDDKPFVFEVNTAPGLVGTTLEIYIKEFQDALQGL